ncbi:MAG: hypothetical protein HYV33_06570 [Candidatus Kerfeldbacteria bacterium]|nr:hypothetical protein [Candidatus Kerfeldbacteria bacterium]
MNAGGILLTQADTEATATTGSNAIIIENSNTAATNTAATEQPKKKKKQKDVTTVTATEETDTSTYSLDQAFNQVNIGNPTWDLFLVGFFVVGALLYGLSLGKDRIIAIMVSIYMALAVVAALPEFVLNIKVNDSYTVQITAFFSVFVVLFFLLSRQAVLNALSPDGHGKWWQVLLFSVLHVGLLVSVTMSFLPPNLLAKFSPLSQMIFTQEWTKFSWIMAPIIAMMLVGRNRD